MIGNNFSKRRHNISELSGIVAGTSGSMFQPPGLPQMHTLDARDQTDTFLERDLQAVLHGSATVEEAGVSVVFNPNM